MEIETGSEGASHDTESRELPRRLGKGLVSYMGSLQGFSRRWAGPPWGPLLENNSGLAAHPNPQGSELWLVEKLFSRPAFVSSPGHFG